MNPLWEFLIEPRPLDASKGPPCKGPAVAALLGLVEWLSLTLVHRPNSLSYHYYYYCYQHPAVSTTIFHGCFPKKGFQKIQLLSRLEIALQVECLIGWLIVNCHRCETCNEEEGRVEGRWGRSLDWIGTWSLARKTASHPPLLSFSLSLSSNF